MTSPPTAAPWAQDVPAAITRPWSMTTISSASSSASSRYWVVSSSVVPSTTQAPDHLPHPEPGRGSRPVVGSSRNSTFGCPTRLAARSSRRCMPPEYVLVGRSAASVRPNCSSSSVARVPVRGRAQVVQPTDDHEVLAAGELLLNRRGLAGQPDRRADRGRIAHHVLALDEPCPPSGCNRVVDAPPPSSCPPRSARAPRARCREAPTDRCRAAPAPGRRTARSSPPPGSRLPAGPVDL